MKNTKFANKNDIILICCILSVAFALLVAREISNRNVDRVYGEVLLNGVPVKTVSLLENQTFYIEEIPQVLFEVRDGGIAFVYSDCPDQICVYRGFLHRSGQAAACLPFGLTLTVFGTTDSYDDIDIFTS